VAGHPIFAWFYSRLAPRFEAKDGTRERRIALLSHASGRVLEVGAGTGLNLPHYTSEVTELLATEPDPHMFRRLARALPTAQVPVRLRRASAEALPAEDGWADAVVCTLVLCSVDDLHASLGEGRRVLRPGGVLLFYEHVRAQEAGLARWEDRFERPWAFFAAGCHPNRDTVRAVEMAGFTIEELERFDVPGAFLARPHVQGVARKA
jgi:ubiquinone/menaquinone biosynthesis C-methylase UbiE